MSEYIEYRGKKSTDFGLQIEKRKIGDPVKRKTEVTIPYRNSTVDFNKITGITPFDDRSLEYKLWKKCNSPREVTNVIVKITNWLMNGVGKSEMIDSVFDDGGKWTAECIGVDSSESTAKIAKFTVKFKANAYRIIETEEEVEILF